MFDICCIGHITLDRVVTSRGTMHMAGGTAYYFSYALSHMAVNYGLVTALAPAEMQSVRELRETGINVNALASEHTVYFENIYAENQDQRTQRVLQEAGPFTVADLKDTEATLFHLGPLLAGDIPTELVKDLFSRGNVALDAQGYLREVIDKSVHAIDWAEKKEALQYVDILKVNEHELEVLAGITDIRAGARVLAGWGVKEVVITLGSRGSVIYADDIFYEIPAYKPMQVTDATGCGDTYMAGYLYRRVKGHNISDAGNFASAMAGLKVENAGPFKGTEQDVINMMNRAST